MPKLFTAWILLALILAGCLGQSQQAAIPIPSLTATQTPFPPTLTPTVTPSPTGTVTSTPEPHGCLKPPDDYTRVDLNGWTINQRTMAMLAHAQQMYGGELE